MTSAGGNACAIIVSMDANEDNLRKFARLLLLMPLEPFKAALAMTDNAGEALKIAHYWPTHPLVIEEKKRILAEDGEGDYLPSKFDIVSEAWGIARNGLFEENRLKALELVAKITDHMPKTGPGVQVNVQNNRVMIVKDHGSDDAWEAKLRQQQTALINGDYTKLN